MSYQSDALSYLCSELVSVLYADQSRNTRSTIANLEEISAYFATLLSDQRPQAGRPIAFSAKGHDLYGTVESIDVDETLGCFTKVKFDPMCRWHERLFVPKHFLALCASPEQAKLNCPAALPLKAFTLSEP